MDILALETKPNKTIKLLFANPRVTLLVILALGLILRLIIIFFVPVPFNINSVDQNRYDALAWNISQGKGYTNYLSQPEIKDPPLFPLTIGLTYLVFGHNLLPMYLLQAFLSTACAGLIFLLTQGLYDTKTGLVAAFLVTCYPDFVFYSATLLTETLFIFFLCAGMYFWSQALTTSKWLNWILTGFSLALASLARPTAQLFILPILVISWFVWKHLQTKGNPKLNLFLCLVAFMVTIAPWTVRNYLAYHAFVPIAVGSGIALWVGTNVEWGGNDVRGDESIYGSTEFTQASAASDPITSDRNLTVGAIQHVTSNPLGELKILPKKFILMNRGPSSFGFYFPIGTSKGNTTTTILRLFELAVYFPIILLALVGTWLLWRVSKPKLLIILTPIIYISLLTLATIPAQRYMLPTMPFLIVLAAYSLKNKLRVPYLFSRRYASNRAINRRRAN